MPQRCSAGPGSSSGLASAPNEVYPEEVAAGWLRDDRLSDGYYGAPFVEEGEASVPAPQAATYPESATSFRFVGPPPAAYESVFLRGTGRLLEREGTAVVALHVPTARERGQDVIRERFVWSDALGVPCDIVGIPSATLFAGVPEGRFYHYYYDEHMNGNGARLFTAAVASALVQAYHVRAVGLP